MSGRNNMQYKYYRICFGLCMQAVTLWWQVVQPFTRNLCMKQNWTSYVKRESDVALVALQQIFQNLNESFGLSGRCDLQMSLTLF